jgi:hypothetical protein
MKDNLIKHLDELYDNLLDYRSRFLHAKIECEKSGELDSDAIEDLDQIRHSMSYIEDRISELKEKIGLRVYCVQVTSTIEMNVKVLAKNEDDAIEWAEQTADIRIEDRFASHYDCSYSSQGYSLGDESTEDDEAEEEYLYED